MYSRSNNPNVLNLEQLLTVLEGGEDTVCLSTGMAAVTSLILAAIKPKGHIVCGKVIYETTYLFIKETLGNMGFESDDVDTCDLEATKAAIKPNTSLVFIESPANPTFDISDIVEISSYAHKVNPDCVVAVDSTMASPYNLQPLLLGADASIHSMTKYICGHGDSLGGSVSCKSKALSKLVRDKRHELGCCLGPFDAWVITRGLRTLSLRMERHNVNGNEVALFLHKHPKVIKVYHPLMEDFRNRDIAFKQMKGFASCFSFRVAGGYDGAIKFLLSVKMISVAVSLGTLDTLVEFPFGMTNADWTEDTMGSVGITNDLIRIAVGIEDLKDIIADLDQALNQIEEEKKEVRKGSEGEEGKNEQEKNEKSQSSDNINNIPLNEGKEEKKKTLTLASATKIEINEIERGEEDDIPVLCSPSNGNKKHIEDKKNKEVNE